MHILKKGQKFLSMFERKHYFSSDVFRILKKVLELIIIQEEVIEWKKKIKDDKSRAGVVVLFIYIAYLIFLIFLHSHFFRPENFTLKSAWIYDKKGLATKQRKFATQISLRQNSINYNHREQIDIFISTVCKITYWV